MVLEALLSFFLGKKTSGISSRDPEKKFYSTSSSSSLFHTSPGIPQIGYDLVRSQFHFPVRYSKWAPPHQISEELEFLHSVFNETSLGGLNLHYFRKVLQKTCSFPKFISTVLFQRLLPQGGNPFTSLVTKEPFLLWWTQHIQPFSVDLRFFNVIKGDLSRDYIVASDLRTFFSELIKTCQPLEFLRNSPIFQARYLDTVLAVYMYKNDRHRTGQISFEQFRKSRIVDILKNIESESDVSALQSYFSYKNFYVIYRKFWELDTDHDMLLSIGDLSRYGNGALSTRALRRIFQLLQGPTLSTGPVSRDRRKRSNVPRSLIDLRMSFSQFVWFILSEEDKTTEHAWRYWFNIADRDEDGVISAYDIEYFYEEQTQRQRNSPQYDLQDPVNFQDVFQQLTDIYGDISISFVQICHSGQAEMFFNLLFNLPKFLNYEYSSPSELSPRRTPSNPWDNFVAHEYSLASLEESLSSHTPSDTDDNISSSDLTSDTPTSIDPSESYSDSDAEPDSAEPFDFDHEREGISAQGRDDSVDELLWAKRINHKSMIGPQSPPLSKKPSSPSHSYTKIL